MCSQDSCGERLRPGPGLFLAVLTAGPGRRLAVPQRLAFSVQSLVEPSVSAFRYMMRSCPRIKMGGGWEGAIWKRRRSLSSFGPALHIPLSRLSYLGLCVIFARLCSKHAWCHDVEDTCPSPSVITDGWTSLGLQVEGCLGNPAERRALPMASPLGQRPRGTHDGAERGSSLPESVLQEDSAQPTPPPAWPQGSPGKPVGCAQLILTPLLSFYHSAHTPIPMSIPQSRPLVRDKNVSAGSSCRR